MGGGGKSSTQSQGTSKQHSEFHYPEWYEAAGKENYDREGQAIKDRPYEPYRRHGGAGVLGHDRERLKWIEDNAGSLPAHVRRGRQLPSGS